MNRLAWINVLAGMWMIISPWVLGFEGNMAATWSAVITGIIVGLVALAGYFGSGSYRARVDSGVGAGREVYRP